MRCLKLFLGFPLIITSNCYCQKGYNHLFNIKTGPYSIGYLKEIHIVNSRTFKRKWDYYRNRNLQNNRQIQMHIWYPAQIAESDTLVTYKKYIVESAVNTTGGKPNIEDIEETLSRYREQLLSIDIDSNLIENFLETDTKAYWHTQFVQKKFPIIIYAPSINSNPYENIVLIEYLVSNGYVVVSGPSIGNGSLLQHKFIHFFRWYIFPDRVVSKKCMNLAIR